MVQETEYTIVRYESKARISNMENNYSSFWGIDVSKEWADICIDNKSHRITQATSDIKKFIKQNYSNDKSVLAVLESTGGYERLLAKELDSVGITVHIAHPNKVRNYAKAKGYLAKTDKLDAKVLAQYGKFIDPNCIKRLPSKIELKLGFKQRMKDKAYASSRSMSLRIYFLQAKRVSPLDIKCWKKINKIEKRCWK